MVKIFAFNYSCIFVPFKDQAPVFATTNLGIKKKLAFGVSAALLCLSQQAQAHVEYYDLNQGKQIGDLTAAGKAASTTQYGSTPAAVVALGGKAANGLGIISTQQDLPLNNPGQWNGTNQSYTGVGSFTGLIYTPTSSSATVNVNDVTDFGWGAGTKPVLGDSHKVGFFNFRLSQTSTVTISWNVDDGEGNYYDNAFTLYRGFLPYQGHDDGNEKLNPIDLKTKVQDVLDSLSAPVDVQGIASSYRKTIAGAGYPGTYVGQFNALANWGQANVSGNWGNVAFLKAVNGNVGSVDGYAANAGDTLETLSITLDAGNYTIAASGALGAIANASAGTLSSVDSFGQTNLHGQLTFTAKAAKKNQTISAISLLPATLTAGKTTVASATANSGLAVTFTSSTPTICTISGSIVTGKAVGACTLAANQAGNASYNKALQVTKTITISKGGQVITFGAMPASLVIGGISNIPATSTSGLSLSFSSTTPSICTVSGSTIKGIAGGNCIIAANQAGNAIYNPAVQKTQSITIAKSSQTLIFGAVPVITVGKAGLVSASTTSKLAVSFSTGTAGICSVNGTTVIGKAVGTCIIAANQGGNANYNPAPQKTQSVIIGKGAQVLTFGAVPVITVGKTGLVSATGNTAGLVSFSSATTGICSVNGTTVIGKASGTCIIAANQIGNANYNPAAQVTKAIPIGKGAQVLTFGAAPVITVGKTGLVSVTGNAAGAVSFSTTTAGICSVSGATVTGKASGTCIVTANQGGNANYSPALQKTQSVIIGKGAQALTFGAVPVITVGKTGPVSVTGNTAGAVSFSTTTANICSVSGATITGKASGTCIIAANQVGNANYNQALQKTQSIPIKP